MISISVYKNIIAENSVRMCNRRTKILDLILNLCHLFTLLQWRVKIKKIATVRRVKPML